MSVHDTGATGCGAKAAGGKAGGGGGTVLSLPVLSTGHPKVKKSKMGKWRAGVLIAVHLIIVAHIVQWLITGMTITPVEPSESMYTLELGRVNAGFVFFVLALLSTLIFGRFFCGWGCHVVALQDLCSTAMTRLGVRPKPFRSRLLLLAPLCLALYMFVWPTFRREVVARAYAWAETPMPAWIGEPTPLPGFEAHFVTDSFWATFPPWYVAIPFFLVVGFAAVYFLGSKGFCTYGCPYGGFFAPIDRLAPGRILVNDSCEGCGHCTAVCTSNVRVHEEVRDYGMVVDPGCMKCLDCVSVCPNDALRFGFATPAFLVKPRTPEAAERRKAPGRLYDLSRWEEAWVALVFFGLFLAFRGMFGLVPMLMAMGMGAIGAFVAWKLIALVRVQNVRLQRLQLRFRGSLTRAGAVFAALGVLFLASGAWAGAVRYNLWRGAMLDHRVTATTDMVFAPGYQPKPQDREPAERALRHYLRADTFNRGGFGWGLTKEDTVRVSWLHAVSGRLDEAETYLRRALAMGTPADLLVSQLASIVYLRTGSMEQVVETFREAVRMHPGLSATRLELARIALSQGKPEEAATQAEAVLVRLSDDEHLLLQAADLLLGMGRADRALELLRAASAARPRSAELRGGAAVALAILGRSDEAIGAMEEAVGLAPDNPSLRRNLARLLETAGRGVEARTHLQEADRLQRTHGAEPPK